MVKVGRPPKASSPAASKRMKSNISKGTGPEIRLRRALWEVGLRGYRLNWKKAPGSPDIVFPDKKIAIFVHGCFWHNCPTCNKKLPKKNRDYWERKRLDNEERDRRKERALVEEGWRVIIAWECAIKERTAEVVDEIYKCIQEGE